MKPTVYRIDANLSCAMLRATYGVPRRWHPMVCQADGNLRRGVPHRWQPMVYYADGNLRCALPIETYVGTG
jgi:hypothetical protein